MSSINPYENSENNLVEQPTIKLFEKLGWEKYNAFKEFDSKVSPLERKERNEIVLVSRLRNFLVKYNPTISKESINKAIEEFTRDRRTMGSLKANEEIYKFLKDGMNIKIQRDEEEIFEKVFFIDWNNIENNDFLLVSQLWITGDY